MITWTRRLEFASLTIATWIYPLSSILFSFLWIVFVLPTTNTPFMDYSMIIIFLFVGIIWNTKYGIGGMLWISAFKHYLQNKETEEDRKTARDTWIASIFLPLIIIVFFSLFINLIAVK